MFNQPDQSEVANNWLKARRERALRYLATREHSVAELTSKLAKLTKKEQEQPSLLPSATARQAVIDNLISELIEQNYLSNQRFIVSLSNKILRQGKGPQAFKMACQEHQLESYLVSEKLEKLEALWPAQIERVAIKKFGEQMPSEQKEKAKAYRFLASRGFTPNQIHSLFN